MDVLDLIMKLLIAVLAFFATVCYGEDIQQLEQKCLTNDPDSCGQACQAYIVGKEAQQSYTKGFEVCSKGCELKNGFACLRVAQLYGKGDGVEQSIAKAQEFYEKACNLQEAPGCLSLGEIYAKGIGVPQSFEKANEFYKKSCDLGEALGCFALGANYRAGRGIAQSIKDAVLLFEKACKGKNGLACYAIGEMFAKGFGVVKEEKTAFNYYKQACGLNIAKACNELLNLEKHKVSTSSDNQSLTAEQAVGIQNGFEFVTFPENISECPRDAVLSFEPTKEESDFFFHCLDVKNSVWETNLKRAMERAISLTKDSTARKALREELDKRYNEVLLIKKRLGQAKNLEEKSEEELALQNALIDAFIKTIDVYLPPSEYAKSPYYFVLVKEDMDEAYAKALALSADKAKLESEQAKWKEKTEVLCDATITSNGNYYGVEQPMFDCTTAMERVRTAELNALVGLPQNGSLLSQGKEMNDNQEVNTTASVSLLQRINDTGAYPNGFYPAKVRQLCRGWNAEAFFDAYPPSKKDVNCLKARVSYLKEQMSKRYSEALRDAKNKRLVEREQKIFETMYGFGNEIPSDPMELASQWMLLTNRVLELVIAVYPEPKYSQKIEELCQGGTETEFNCMQAKEKAIQADYKELLNKTKGKTQDKLKVTQQSWQKDLNSICEFGGTTAPNYLAAYMFEETCKKLWISLRAAELAEMLKEK